MPSSALVKGVKPHRLLQPPCIRRVAWHALPMMLLWCGHGSHIIYAHRMQADLRPHAVTHSAAVMRAPE